MTVVAHLFWMLLGPAALVFTAIWIALESRARIGRVDLLYAGLLLLNILARYLDQASGAGLTSEGEPSTWRDFRVYTLKVILLGAGVWLLIRGIGRFV